MTDINEIWKYELRRGNSTDPSKGACLLDAVSWLEYGTLGDHPPCVCPVIAAFGRGINDAMSDGARQWLKLYIPRLVGTVDPEHEQARAVHLAWQAICVLAPMALDAVGQHNSAAILRNFTGTLHDAAAAAAAVAEAWAATWPPAEAARWAAMAARWAAEAEAEAAARWAADAATAARWAAAAAAAAAWAAEAAARTAEAAAAAARTAEAAADAENAMFAALDGVLAIGRQADPILPGRLFDANESFALARAGAP